MKLKWKISLVVLMVILGIYFYFRTIPIQKNDVGTVFDGKELRIAHRCGRGILPENTLFACKEIFQKNLADILEMDVHLTKDGHLVVIHDESVDRTTNGKGKVAELTYNEIKVLDAGYHFTQDGKTFPFREKGIQILELEEFFKAIPLGRYYIELKVKTPLAAQILVGLIEKHNLEDRVFIGSVYDSVNANLKKIHTPKIKIFSGLKETSTWYFLYLLGIRGIVKPPEVLAIPNIPLLMPVDKNFINAAREQNIKLHIFTINEREQIKKFQNLGIDGIMTDNPYLFSNE
jgi:glycerophosphoryl diester phosphodiesterase